MQDMVMCCIMIVQSKGTTYTDQVAHSDCSGAEEFLSPSDFIAILTSSQCKVAQIDEAVVKMAKNFNLGMDDDDTEEILEVVSEELTNIKLLELEK